MPVGGSVFLKGPKLQKDLISTVLLPRLILQEVQILELLRRNPHPHIIHYHGCLIRRGLIVSIVLYRYPMTLKERLESDMRGFNVERCISEIKSAAKHLHSLGLAHNDLTPMNIMIDENDTSVVIDFGSCQPFGCDLITAGTPGRIDEDFTHSAQDHDEVALHKLQTWLEMRRSSIIKE
ncbi:hypothetical protein EJ04DRAFT_480166 [Polyplosphaeria fusca]|uniref:Protein kinase domain-containing protein n=1 Tax=Polyplosphaeria fusca TaxID=682080 RepID=A0A9P4UVB8_9PLEO|nr:hypothetical protein EJ04DRAFT_480166 [Polyplosphaeria fusca]